MISEKHFGIALLVTVAWTAGCEPQNQPLTSSLPPNAAPRKIDGWMGRWNGPEGTYLELSKSGARYEIRIKDLDKVQTYDGTAAADSISFERSGKTETIHSGNGEQTGMKWLLDKKDCLVIRRGEGYCRD